VSENKNLEFMLNQIKRKNKPIVEQDDVQIIENETAHSSDNSQKLDVMEGKLQIEPGGKIEGGFFENRKKKALKLDKDIKAQEIIYENQLERLKHQAEAIERQSKAYHAAKSVTFKKGVEAFAQAEFQELENVRLENKLKALRKAQETAANSMRDASNSNLPDPMKLSLLEIMNESLENTMERIKDDTTAVKNDLASD
jgi:hypothetical protein